MLNVGVDRNHCGAIAGPLRSQDIFLNSAGLEEKEKVSFSRFRLLAEQTLAACAERAYTGAMRRAWKRFVIVWSGWGSSPRRNCFRFCRAKPDRFGQHALEIWPQFLPPHWPVSNFSSSYLWIIPLLRACRCRGRQSGANRWWFDNA